MRKLRYKRPYRIHHDLYDDDNCRLLLAYKKINKMKGYKMVKLKFETELETDIIKAIVILCGGDPNKAAHLFSSA